MKQAVFFRDRATTYGELITKAECVSAALRASGVGKGDVVGIYMSNCTEFLQIFLGVAKCGAIAQPINTLLTEYEIKPQLAQSQAKAIFVSETYRSLVEGMADDLPDLKSVVPMPKETTKDDGSPFSEFLKTGNALVVVDSDRSQLDFIEHSNEKLALLHGAPVRGHGGLTGRRGRWYHGGE